jgi:hypothetical protein
LYQDSDVPISDADNQDWSTDVNLSESVECIDIRGLDGGPQPYTLDISWYAGHGILHSGRALFRGWRPETDPTTYPHLVRSLQDLMGYEEGKHVIMYRLLGDEEIGEVGNHAELRRVSFQLMSMCGMVRLKLHIMSVEKWAKVCENFDGRVARRRN